MGIAFENAVVSSLEIIGLNPTWLIKIEPGASTVVKLFNVLGDEINVYNCALWAVKIG